MRRVKKERQEFNPKNFRKGKLLVVKVPPFYDKEYLYEVSGAGGSVVRANLYHSTRVKKQWSIDDLELLFDSGMIRLADDADLQRLNLNSVPENDEADQDKDLDESTADGVSQQEPFKRDRFY